MRTHLLLSLTFILALLTIAPARAEEGPPPLKLMKDAQRIVFLGDSITASGGYVAAFDAWLVAQRWERTPTVINMGLPSETVSGLSEEGHAGGAFPRPDLAERLDRVLATAKPDLVFACYGINCGIYQPFDEKRFERYQQGIKHLKATVEKAGAKLIVITPPFYDAQKQPKQAFYNGVLDRYSEWLGSQRASGYTVIDVHAPMTKEVAARREKDAAFTFAPDGVHPNDAGHWFIAQQLIAACGDEKAAAQASPEKMLAASDVPAEVWPLVQRRMSVLRDAYVATAGHKRPGVAKGLPLDQANEEAAKLSQQIAALRKR
jgi:lysophospholipase L1-like esterase